MQALEWLQLSVGIFYTVDNTSHGRGLGPMDGDFKKGGNWQRESRIVYLIKLRWLAYQMACDAHQTFM